MEDGILGYVYATSYRPRPAYASIVEMTIYLSPTATRGGIGRRLLRELIEPLKAVSTCEGREDGIKEVLAFVAVDEGRDASGVYEREGFREVGRLERVGWKGRRWVDVRSFQMGL